MKFLLEQIRRLQAYHLLLDDLQAGKKLPGLALPRAARLAVLACLNADLGLPIVFITDRADHALPSAPGRLAMTWAGSADGPQNRQAWVRGVGSMTSSPVITQERVMGSLRSSMA